MKTKIPFVLTLLLAGLLAHADEPTPITVAVYDFDSPYRGSIRLRNDIAITASLLAANLSTNPCFNLVERAELKTVLKEEAFGQSGNIRPETAARIGQLTGAKVLITGKVLNITRSDGSLDIIAANIIGTETGRVFTQSVQGERTNIVALVSDLSRKIAQTIISHRTNFIGEASVVRDQRISRIVEGILGKERPAVSIKIDDQISGVADKSETVQTELGLIFQKAGYTVVDEKSDRKPDIFVTGSALTSTGEKSGDLFSSRATLEIKAQEQKTGKIMTIDRQESVAVDIGEQTSAKKALENAADDLAERLLPLLVK